jgi:hypothetical protein
MTASEYIIQLLLQQKAQIDKISADLEDLRKQVKKKNDKNETEWLTEVVSNNLLVKKT